MKTAFIILGHGSRREEVSSALAQLVARLRPRLEPALVEPAFFSLGSPGLEEKARELDSRGVSRVVIFPYFLFNGIHVHRDIPELVQSLQEKYPRVQWEVLSSLENDPMLDELVFERLWEIFQGEIIRSGKDIEFNSLEFIRNYLRGWGEEKREVASRVIHATADFSFAQALRFSSGALEKGVSALQSKAPVYCDVRMLAAGMTRADNVRCLLDQVQGDVSPATTRAAQGVQTAFSSLHGSVLVVGNSPTSLWSLLDLHAETGISPALVIGLPVGFVGAAQSKEALWYSGLDCITNSGPKGGSPAASAAFNALAILGEKND